MIMSGLRARYGEYKKIKNLIKENFRDGDCGLFNTRNIAGDLMTNIFKGHFFALDICYNYSYFEIFGMNEEEFKELEEYYNSLESECEE